MGDLGDQVRGVTRLTKSYLEQLLLLKSDYLPQAFDKYLPDESLMAK